MRKAAVWLGGTVLVLVLAWGTLHVLISPVNPEQTAPPTHYGGPCWACHFVTRSVPVRDL